MAQSPDPIEVVVSIMMHKLLAAPNHRASYPGLQNETTLPAKGTGRNL